MLATNTRLWAVASSADRKDTLSVSSREFRHRQEGRRSGQWPHKRGLMWPGHRCPAHKRDESTEYLLPHSHWQNLAWKSAWHFCGQA